MMKLNMGRYGWDGLQRICNEVKERPTSKVARDFTKRLARKFADEIEAEVKRREIRGDNLADSFLVSMDIKLNPETRLVPDKTLQRRNIRVEIAEVLEKKKIWSRELPSPTEKKTWESSLLD
jgi:hypothetical protein